MAETLTRIESNVLTPDMNLLYNDVWTDDSGVLEKANVFCAHLC